MKLLLCSNYVYLSGYISKFFDLSKRHKMLFVWYADDTDEWIPDETSSTIKSFADMNFDIIYLNEGYDFKDKIDMVYVKGGNTTKLIHKLKKFNQFEKIRELVIGGAVYVGQSAGSVLAGSDTEWTLRSEPYDCNLKKEYGDGALLGYGFVNKMIFVHCSKLRFPFHDEEELAGRRYFRVKNTLFYKEYLKDKLLFSKNEYIVLGDNQAFYQNGEEKRILTLNWSKFPVLDEYRLH